MGYCVYCENWAGLLGNQCDHDKCEITRKLINLYGIDRIGEALERVFIRNDKALEFRANKLVSKSEAK